MELFAQGVGVERRWMAGEAWKAGLLDGLAVALARPRFERSYTLSAAAGERELSAIRALVLRLVPPAKP